MKEAKFLGYVTFFSATLCYLAYHVAIAIIQKGG